VLKNQGVEIMPIKVPVLKQQASPSVNKRLNLTPQTVTLFVPKIPPACYAV
jgi:hypothetical protein